MLMHENWKVFSNCHRQESHQIFSLSGLALPRKRDEVESYQHSISSFVDMN